MTFLSASLRPLGIAVVSVLALAPAAFAQDSGDDAAKRFAVVGSATILQPDSDPVRGARLDIDGDVAPTLSASWYATPNIAVELWGAADKFNHRVRSDAGKIGTIDSQPIALSGQYHFGAPSNTFRPFLGLGYYESNYSGEQIAGSDGLHVGVDTAKGGIATAGLDINISPSWFARTDVRYMKGKSDINVAGEKSGQEMTYDPWTVGIGLGARF